MTARVQYDDLADIYDVWTRAAGKICDENRRFYVERYLETEGPAVELGVGDGRIAVEAAARGKPMVGVDHSAAMLELCRARATEAGVSDEIELHRADFRDFRLSEPAALITIPYRTIGHLLDLEAKRAGLEHVRESLAPGGRLIFDHFVADPAWMERSGVPTLHAEYTDAKTGADALLWVTSVYDVPAKRLRIVALTEELDADGLVQSRRARRIDFSWIDPPETRALLERCGFEVEAAYGDFAGTPLGPESTDQIWVARRS